MPQEGIPAQIRPGSTMCATRVWKVKMHFVDILIPLLFGLILLMFPGLFLRKGGREEEQNKKRRWMQKIG
jgi:hypothetical protein